MHPGLYIAGGIALYVLPEIGTRLFLSTFWDKGRLSPLLTRISIHLTLELGTARSRRILRIHLAANRERDNMINPLQVDGAKTFGYAWNESVDCINM